MTKHSLTETNWVYKNATVVSSLRSCWEWWEKGIQQSTYTYMQELCSGSRIVADWNKSCLWGRTIKHFHMLYPHQQSQNGEHLREKRRLNLIRCHPPPRTADPLHYSTRLEDRGVVGRQLEPRQLQRDKFSTSEAPSSTVCCAVYPTGQAWLCAKCDDIQTKSQFKSCQPLTMNNTRLRLNWAFLQFTLEKYPCG